MPLLSLPSILLSLPELELHSSHHSNLFYAAVRSTGLNCETSGVDSFIYHPGIYYNSMPFLTQPSISYSVLSFFYLIIVFSLHTHTYSALMEA